MSGSEIARATNTTKKVNRYYAKLIGIPSNISNIIGKNTKRVSRPNITIPAQKVHHRKGHFNATMKLDYGPMTMVFHDDEDSVVANMLYAQLLRQFNRGPDNAGTDTEGRERADTFDVEVEIFNQHNQAVEKFKYLKCRIVGISGTDMDMKDKETNSEITVECVFDGLDSSHYDEFIRQIGEYGN